MPRRLGSKLRLQPTTSDRAQKAVGEQVKLLEGYTMAWSDKYQHLQSVSERLGFMVPIVLGLVFLLLYLNFSGLKLEVLIFLGAARAATGGTAILYGVVLVSYIEEERAAGANAADAARGAGDGAGASIGFVPMAISTGTGAEVQRPLATMVIGGLITATLLTLLVLPSLYPMLDALHWPAKWRRKGQTLPIRRPSASTIAPPRQAVVHWFEQVAAAKEKLQAKAIERLSDDECGRPGGKRK